MVLILKVGFTEMKTVLIITDIKSVKKKSVYIFWTGKGINYCAGRFLKLISTRVIYINLKE